MNLTHFWSLVQMPLGILTLLIGIVWLGDKRGLSSPLCIPAVGLIVTFAVWTIIGTIFVWGQKKN